MRSSLPETIEDEQEQREHRQLRPPDTAHHLPVSNVQLMILCASVIIGLLVLIPAGIVLAHAVPILVRLAPILGIAFVLFLLSFMAIGIYGAFGAVRIFLKRQEVQLRTFTPDPGTPNYPAYLNDDGT